MDKVKFLGREKTIIKSAEDTAQVLERIHKDGHLGIKKTLKLFRRRFKGVREKPYVKQLFHLARVASSVPITIPEPYSKGRSSWYPLGMLYALMLWDHLFQEEKGNNLFYR